MLFRFRFGLVIVFAASALWLGGCRSPSSQPVPVEKRNRSLLHSEQPEIAESELVEAHAHYATALVHELNEETEPALNEYFEAAVRDLENETLVMEVSRRLLQARQPEKAQELLIRATALPKASGNLFARLGFIYFQLGKKDEAVLADRTAIRREPRSIVGYQNLFLIFLQQKKTDDALSVLDQAAKVSKPSFEFLVSLGELYSNYGLQNPAQRELANARGAAVLERAAREKPTDPQVRLRLADGLNMLGKSDEAAKIYQEVLKQLPDMPFLKEGVRSKLTDIYLRGKDRQRAAEQLESIVRDNPTDAQAYYYLGSLAYSETNYLQAADYFSKVILLNPEFAQGYYDLAAAQLNGDQAADALVTLEKARARFPQRFYPEYLTGMAYSQQKDFTNALKHLTTAEIIAQATDEKQALKDSFYFQLGVTSERAGDFAQAEKYFEKCLELSPNDDEAQNYLGFMLADRGEKLEHARELIEKALKARPGNAAYLDSMGWVLFRLNQPGEALGFLLDAIKNSEEEDATIYDHIGDVYAALKQTDKAREAWARSVKLEANAAVQKKLDALATGQKARP